MTDYLSLLLEEQLEHTTEKTEGQAWETFSLFQYKRKYGERIEADLRESGEVTGISDPEGQTPEDGTGDKEDTRSAGQTSDAARQNPETLQELVHPAAFLSAGVHRQNGLWKTAVSSGTEEGGENTPQTVSVQGWAAGQSVRNWMAGTAYLPQAGVRTIPEYDETEAPSVQEDAWWANRCVQISLQAPAGHRVEHSVVTVERTADRLSAQRLEAERLDRLFRRDARRYDGGYQLL